MNKLKVGILIGIVVIIILGIIFLRSNLTGRATLESEEEVIKIGYIGVLSGEGAIYGLTEKAGLDMALEEINSKGGVNGKKIKVIYEDNKLDTRLATEAANKLIEIDKVKAIFILTSDASFAVKPITERNKIPLLTTGTFNSQLYKDGDYIFGFWPTSEKTSRDLANFLIKKYDRVGIISSNVGENVEIHQDFTKKFQELGGEVVVREKASWDEMDYSSYITKIKSKSPEALVINGYGDFVAVSIVQEMIKQGLDIPIYGNYAFSGGVFREALGESVEGAVFVDASSLNNPNNPKGLEFFKKLEKVYPEYVSDWEAGITYEGLYVLAQTIEEVGSDGEKMKDYLHETEFEGILGKFHFGPHGEFLGVENEFKQIKNGEIVTLKD